MGFTLNSLVLASRKLAEILSDICNRQECLSQIKH